MKQHLIFDFDGTLADTFSLFIEILNENKERFGSNGIDESEIPKLRDMSPMYLLKEFNLHILRLPKEVLFIRSEVSKRLDRVVLFKDIPEMLKNFKEKNFIVGVLTSNSVANVSKVLKKYDIELDFIHSESSILGKHKALKRIIKLHNLDKERTLYIADEIRDIEACNKIDLDICSVTWGFNSKEVLQKHNPDFVVDSVKDLAEVIIGK